MIINIPAALQLNRLEYIMPLKLTYYSFQQFFYFSPIILKIIPWMMSEIAIIYMDFPRI